MNGEVVFVGGIDNVIDDEQLQRLCDGMVALVAGLQAEDMRA